MLSIGIVDQNEHHVPVSKLYIQAKACSIFEYLSKGVKKVQPFSASVGRGSSVGIATDNGLDSLGIESRWDEIFCTCPDRSWGPPSLLYNGYQVFPGG
jgi:hypothetical protein